MIGNSAGGTHLATYLDNASVQPADGPSVAGAIWRGEPRIIEDPRTIAVRMTSL
jgi:hypothetical protein